MTYGITPMAAIVETKILVAQQPEQTIVLTGIGVPGPTGPQGPAGAAETPNSILTKLLTVDGHGSNLDADLLDGQHGAYYLDLSNATGTINATKHANLAGGALHALATTSVAGFLAPGDKTKIDGLTTTYAPIASPVFTGDPKAPTPPPGDNDTSIATTAYVTSTIGSSTIDWTQVINEPATFPPTLPIAQSGVTGLVSDLALKAPIANPIFTGDPQAPTPATADNDTSIATTAFVKAQGYAPLASPTFTGDPKAPTPTAGDNDTSVATTAFVTSAVATAKGTADTDYVNVTGDTMTGDLNLTYADPYLYLNGGTVSDPAIWSTKGGLTKYRWGISMANSPETGSNAGSNFIINRCDDAGNDLPYPFAILRQTGKVLMPLGALLEGGKAAVSEAPADGITYGRKDAAWSAVVGGAVISDTAPAGPLAPGQLWWESDTGNTYIWYVDADSSQWIQQNIQPAGGADSSWPGQFINFTTTASLSGLKFAQADVGSGVRGTSFVWNDKADFTGNDLMTLTDTGSLQVGVTAGQTNALIKARTGASSNSLEWGHPNVAGYGSTLGCDQGSGASFIALHGEAGTTNNTHRTRGIRATIIKSDMLGGLLVQNVATASADNQTPVTLATINNAGTMTITSTVATAGATNAAFTVAGGIGANRGMWIADNNGYPSFDGQGGMVGLDFAGPGTNYGMIMRNRAAGSAGMILFRNTSSTAGVITCPTITTTTYATSSDIRLKSEVQPATDARSLVDAIEVIEYTPVDSGPALRTIEGQEPADVKWLGISAQQTYSIYPPAVVTPDIDMPNYREGAQFGDEDFMPWMVDHSKLVPMLLANVQELNKRVDELTARIAVLEGAA